MQIKVKEVKDLTVLERIQLFRLSMQENGRMCDSLREYKNKKGAICFFIEIDGTIKSWAITFEEECQDHSCQCLMYQKGLYRIAFFYTQKSERQKGYGSVIANRLRADFPNALVYKVKRNKDFFNKHGFEKYNRGDE